MSALEETFQQLWAKKYPECPLERGGVGSFKLIGIDSTRSQIDFYHLDSKVIVEIQGATHKGRAGGHTSSSGVRRDYVKQMLAQSQGWCYLELDSTMLKNKLVQDLIYDIIQKRIKLFSGIPVPESTITWADWKPLFPKSKTRKAAKVPSTLEEYTD